MVHSFGGIFNKNYPGNNVVFLLQICIKYNICDKAIVRLVNTIRSRKFSSVYAIWWMHYTKVRLFSAGCDFKQVCQMKVDIVSFFHEKQYSAECVMFKDTFFTDLHYHTNNLNVKINLSLISGPISKVLHSNLICLLGT